MKKIIAFVFLMSFLPTLNSHDHEAPDKFIRVTPPEPSVFA